MNRSRLRLTGALALGGALSTFLFQNCTNVRLTHQEALTSQGLNSYICAVPPEPLKQYSKVLFVVDRSGSNTTTDPNSRFRLKLISEFFEARRSMNFYEWGYVAFGSRNESYITPEGFGDAAAMEQALSLQRQRGDGGGTPYLSALQLTKSIIQNDIDENPLDDSTYNVFFLSDGQPTDGGTVEDDPKNVYIQSVVDIISTRPGKVFFSTFYYNNGTSSPTAASGLSYMAKYGKGYFVNLKVGQAFEFKEIKVGLVPERWIIKRMMAYNLNAGFCYDGAHGVDSDADGLCDRDELRFNDTFKYDLGGKSFDPRHRNSINSQYSDLFSFIFTVLPSGEGLKTCTEGDELLDDDRDLLNSCEEYVLEDSNANGPTPQWTAEMAVAGGGTADPKNPDSDGDGFLDVFEFFQFKIKSTAVNYTSISDRYIGGLTGESLLLEHRHPMNPDITAGHTYQVDFRFSGINDLGENCYTFSQPQVPLYDTLDLPASGTKTPLLAHGARENLIYLYYMMTPERDPNGKGVLRQVIQRATFSNENRTVSVRPGSFDFYRVPPKRSN